MRIGTEQHVDPDQVPKLARELETAPATRIIEWAMRAAEGNLVVACSFQDCVIVDLATQVAPDIEVLFLDTEAHFPETLAFAELVRDRYHLNLTVTKPVAGADQWPCGTADCCQYRKVQPLNLALSGRGGWVTGLKRCDAPTRAEVPVVEWDQARGMLKVNPMATWSDREVELYAAAHHLPVHPLLAQGYLSIGCAPTTKPVAHGGDPRSGRWADSSKTECGLHE